MPGCTPVQPDLVFLLREQLPLIDRGGEIRERGLRQGELFLQRQRVPMETYLVEDGDLARLLAARIWFRQNLPKPRATRGWEEAPLDTSHLLAGLQPLTLAPGYDFRLVFYGMDYGDSISELFAVPSRWRSAPLGARLLNPEAPISDHPDQEQIWLAIDDGNHDDLDFEVPRPPGACPHFMSPVQGDDSPYSYLLASFLSRDGDQPVPSRPALNWATHELLHESLPSGGSCATWLREG